MHTVTGNIQQQIKTLEEELARPKEGVEVPLMKRLTHHCCYPYSGEGPTLCCARTARGGDIYCGPHRDLITLRNKTSSGAPMKSYGALPDFQKRARRGSA